MLFHQGVSRSPCSSVRATVEMPHAEFTSGQTDIDQNCEKDFGRAAKDPNYQRVTWSWDDDPSNPYNWPARLKVQQVLMIASAAFVT